MLTYSVIQINVGTKLGWNSKQNACHLQYFTNYIIKYIFFQENSCIFIWILAILFTIQCRSHEIIANKADLDRIIPAQLFASTQRDLLLTSPFPRLFRDHWFLPKSPGGAFSMLMAQCRYGLAKVPFNVWAALGKTKENSIIPGWGYREDGNVFKRTSPLWDNSTNYPWIPLTKGHQCRSFILAWTKYWTNSWFASYLRCDDAQCNDYRKFYDSIIDMEDLPTVISSQESICIFGKQVNSEPVEDRRIFPFLPKFMMIFVSKVCGHHVLVSAEKWPNRDPFH